jgi:hypothetical protein
MADKQPMQADGDGKGGRPDGVDTPATQGESSGGAYPNPYTGKRKPSFNGGQTDRSYSGPDNPNSTTGPE